MTRAVIGSLRVNMGIDTAAFTAGLQNAQKHLARVTKQMQAIGRQMSATVTAPMALIGGSVLKTAADFEQAMSNMAAVLRPTQDEFKKLEERAIALAQTTKYTAKEAADGMEMLARNGIDAANILGGAAQATLNLASAANASLPSAADAMTDVMVAFKKSGAELDDVVNNIAGTLVNSKMSWEDYYGAMSQAAGISGSAGMSFSDMNAILAATAPAFKNGTEAGTSFKGFLLKLAPSSKQAKEIMKDLNLEFYNSQGFLKSAAEIAEELRVKVGRLTKESQVEVLGTLFGQRTIRTALRLMEEGAEGIERFRAKIAQGDAEQMAKMRLDNFWGSWNMLRAAVESVSIAIGNSGFLEWARGAVDAVAEMARWVAALNPEILRLTAIMSGLVAVAGPIVVAITTIVAGIMLLGGPITWTILAVTALTTAVVAYWDEIKVATRVLVNAFADAFSAITGWVSAIYRSIKEWLLDKFGWVIDGVQKLAAKIGGAFKWLAERLGLGQLLASVKKGFSDAGSAINKTFTSVKSVGVSVGDAVADAWARARKEIDAARDAADRWLAKRSQWGKMLAAGIAPKIEPPKGRSAADDVNLGLYGSDTYDASQHEDAERIIKQMKKTAAELKSEGERVFEATRTPLEAFNIEMNKLNELVRAGAIGFDTYTRAVEQLQDDFSGLTQIADSVSESFGSALEDMIIDGASWRDSLAGFLKDIARELLRVAAITPLMNSLKSGITSAFGSGGGLSLGNLMGFANGGSFQVGGTGGIDSQLVAFRASPNERVTITKPGQEGGGGSSAVFNINIDASGADVAAVSRLEGALAQFKQEMPRMIANTTVNLRDRGMA